MERLLSNDLLGTVCGLLKSADERVDDDVRPSFRIHVYVCEVGAIVNDRDLQESLQARLQLDYDACENILCAKGFRKVFAADTRPAGLHRKCRQKELNHGSVNIQGRAKAGKAGRTLLKRTFEFMNSM